MKMLCNDVRIHDQIETCGSRQRRMQVYQRGRLRSDGVVLDQRPRSRLRLTAELVAYFVGRASDALRRREEALEGMRARAARSERLVSLTRLAAGAAHELSTPLATIALTSRELQRAHGNLSQAARILGISPAIAASARS